MAEHNQWSKVKHIKGAPDANPGKLFSRRSNIGAGDASFNAWPRVAVISAKPQQLPGNPIGHAIKILVGEPGDGILGQRACVGYSVAGVALVEDILTENQSRSTGCIRTIYKKIGARPDTGGGAAPATAAKILRPCNALDACDDSLHAFPNVDILDHHIIEAVAV